MDAVYLTRLGQQKLSERLDELKMDRVRIARDEYQKIGLVRCVKAVKKR